ncbi:hypothetical protein [Rhodovibrio salinarum]|uniref:Uncharacterized protein n=1 Tax=Rhodovibrio salinarum TaxID=1087 RepID=A0A934QG38_9PROT|nr:hypothetical protein [Rhodovibrio salinarum]MBK1695900.1 hypothetical protein [Rhodovibrio salinarum]
MSGNSRRTLELVYSNGRPVGVVEPETENGHGQHRDTDDTTRAIERFLTYLYGELKTSEKRHAAHLVGAAILALRDEFDGEEGGQVHP